MQKKFLIIIFPAIRTNAFLFELTPAVATHILVGYDKFKILSEGKHDVDGKQHIAHIIECGDAEHNIVGGANGTQPTQVEHSLW